MRKVTQISLIAVIAVGIGALAIPGGNSVPQAFAKHYNHVSIHQENNQLNFLCSFSTCHNNAENEASVHIDSHYSSNHVHISQENNQANIGCDHSSCTNNAENSANVHIN